MKVVCDNCRAVYKVPNDKLTKAVNKATCRNCGRRMLIPRPKPGADPEERTLVTAVPPTPVGAPPRVAERPGTPAQDDVDATIPRPNARDDFAMGTPMVGSRVGEAIPAPEDDFDEGETKLSVNPSSMDAYARRSQPPVVQTRTRSSPPRPDPGRRATPPGPPPRRTPGPTSHREEDASMPEPIAMSAVHDPASDLNWALVGTALTLVGGFLLAFLSVFNHALVMWFGLAMTFGGGVLSFTVLLTGARGRRPAKTLLSLVLGFLVAVTMSSAMVGTRWGAERVIDQIRFDNELTPGMVSTPAAEGPGNNPSLASVTPVAEPDAATPEEAPTDAPAEQVAKAAAAPVPAEPDRGRTRPSPAPSRTTRPPAPAPAPPSAPTAESAPAPAPNPPGVMTTVPIEAIHVMLSNNIELKKCFVPLFKAGTLPPRVDVKFNILPSGQATGMGVLQAEHKGSELEGCLSRGIGAIRFPPTSGNGTSITYPFVLK